MGTNTSQNSSLHWLIGGALALTSVFLVIAIVVVNTNADNVSTSATVSNATPAVDSVFISSTSNGGAGTDLTSVTLNAGTTRTVYVNGVVSDANGGTDIADTAVSVKMYRTTATNGSACAADNNDCYAVAGASCTLGAASGTTRAYDCPVALQFWADATDAGAYSATNWTASVTVVDIAGPATSSANTDTTEVNSLTALTIPGSIPYGTLALAAQTTNANNQDLTISQNGNTQADVNVSSAANMTCTIGNIPVANQKWATTDVGFTDVGSTALSGTPTQVSALNVPIRTNDGVNTSSILYMNIGIPVNGVGGSCTGTDVITAVAG